jgi:hypothetical protein
VPFNGEMKEGRRGDFFPSAEVAGGDHGGGARPISGGGYLLYVGVGGGRKLAGPGGPARPKTRREIFFELKIGFLNLQRFWIFIQGNLGGILMWGLFLSSSRILKDFRKIQYAMPCNASYGRLFLERFLYAR